MVIADKGYDNEDNHQLVRETLHAFSVIPARYEHVPIWRTHGRYRKQMKRGYNERLYNQRNKHETIMSVIKRLFGEYISSRLVKTQNRELSFRCIAYNMHRLTNIVIFVMISTWPVIIKFYNYVKNVSEFQSSFLITFHDLLNIWMVKKSSNLKSILIYRIHRLVRMPLSTYMRENK